MNNVPPWGRFTVLTQRIINSAVGMTRTQGRAEMSSTTLMLAMIDAIDPVTIARDILEAKHVSLGDLRRKLDEYQAQEEHQQIACSSSESAEITLSEDVARLMRFAAREAQSLGNNYVGTEHILLAVLRDTDSVHARMLSDLGLAYESAMQEVVSRQN